MRLTTPFPLVAALLAAGCAVPASTSSPSTGSATTASQSTPQSARKDDAELVTGSRIPVRGAQPVRTIDKDEIIRNTRVIGEPAKGN